MFSRIRSLFLLSMRYAFHMNPNVQSYRLLDSDELKTPVAVHLAFSFVAGQRNAEYGMPNSQRSAHCPAIFIATFMASAVMRVRRFHFAFAAKPRNS